MIEIKQGIITYYNAKEGFGYCRSEALPVKEAEVVLVTEPSTKKPGTLQAVAIGYDLSHFYKPCPHCGTMVERPGILGLCEDCRALVYARGKQLSGIIPAANLILGVLEPRVTLLNPGINQYETAIEKAKHSLLQPDRYYLGKTQAIDGILWVVLGEEDKETWHWHCKTPPPTNMVIELLDDNYLLFAWMGCQLFEIPWAGKDLSHEAQVWVAEQRKKEAV